MHPFIHLFGIKIPAYGVMLLLATFTAYFAVVYFSKREGLELKKLENIFLVAFIAALLGARLFYAIEHNLPPDHWLRLWEGGLDFFGGFIFALVAVVLGALYYRLPLWKVADVAAISLLLAHSVGRLSCWLAGCCYGKPTSLPIGVVFPPESVAPPGVPLYPTQLMEATGNFIGYLFLYRLYLNKKPFDGIVAASYLLWYGTERFLLEFLRGVTPPLPGIGLTWNQIVAICAVILGLVIALVRFLRVRERNGVD